MWWIIIIAIVLFVVLGLAGWLLKFIGNVFYFLLNGIRSGCGCIFTIVATLIFIYVAIMMILG